MPIKPLHVDNAVPIELSWRYQLYTLQSSNWVEIIDIRNGKVYVEGIAPTIADWNTPIWKFDDLVVAWEVGGYFISTEHGDYDLGTEDDRDLIFS